MSSDIPSSTPGYCEYFHQKKALETVVLDLWIGVPMGPQPWTLESEGDASLPSGNIATEHCPFIDDFPIKI
jgi:hypothetical protein